MPEAQNPAPYNANPDLNRMREEIADRNFSIRIKSGLIMAATTIAGLAVGGLLFTMIGPMALIGGAALGFMVGGPIAEMFTFKDRKKVEIDEEMLSSYMQGKNYWGAGYRQEVAEYGYAGPQGPSLHGAPPQRPAHRGPTPG